MPRAARVGIPGCPHHIVQRGNNQQDVFFSAMTLAGKRPAGKADPGKTPLAVKDIMTSPAVSATEETEIRKLCRMMQQLRIHRVPIVRDGQVIGIVSSLDICNAVARGDLKE